MAPKSSSKKRSTPAISDALVPVDEQPQVRLEVTSDLSPSSLRKLDVFNDKVDKILEKFVTGDGIKLDKLGDGAKLDKILEKFVTGDGIKLDKLGDGNKLDKILDKLYAGIDGSRLVDKILEKLKEGDDSAKLDKILEKLNAGGDGDSSNTKILEGVGAKFDKILEKLNAGGDGGNSTKILEGVGEKVHVLTESFEKGKEQLLQLVQRFTGANLDPCLEYSSLERFMDDKPASPAETETFSQFRQEMTRLAASRATAPTTTAEVKKEKDGCAQQ